MLCCQVAIPHRIKWAAKSSKLTALVGRDRPASADVRDSRSWKKVEKAPTLAGAKVFHSPLFSRTCTDEYRSWIWQVLISTNFAKLALPLSLLKKSPRPEPMLA